MAGSRCDGSSPASPGPTVNPVVRVIQIGGPDSIPPGQTAQFTATEIMSDGSKRDVTKETTWTTSSPARHEGGGLVTALSMGEAVVVATLFEPSVRQTKRVLLVPEGTFRVSGRVVEWDALSGPIVGARVEVTGDPALFALTRNDGSYVIFGVPGDTELRVTKDGYVTATRRLRIEQQYVADFELKLTSPREDLAGSFTMTISADPSCSQTSFPLHGPTDLLPDGLRQRTYTTTFTRAGNQLKTHVSGATVAPPPPPYIFDNTFGGRSEPGRLFIHFGNYASFVAGDADQGLVERLDSSSYLVIDGEAVISTDSLSGTLNGVFSLVGSDPWKNQPPPIATCFSKAHRIQFVR